MESESESNRSISPPPPQILFVDDTHTTNIVRRIKRSVTNPKKPVTPKPQSKKVPKKTTTEKMPAKKPVKTTKAAKGTNSIKKKKGQ